MLILRGIVALLFSKLPEQYLAPLCCQSWIVDSCFFIRILLDFQLNVIGQNARFLRMSLLPLVRKKYDKVTIVALAKLDVLERTLKQVEDKVSAPRWQMQDVVLFLCCSFSEILSHWFSISISVLIESASCLSYKQHSKCSQIMYAYVLYT